MRPSDQGLNSGDWGGPHIFLRLKIEHEPVVVDCFSELCQKDQALWGLGLALAAIERILDTCCSCPSDCDIAAPDQGGRIGTMGRKDSDAAGCPHIQGNSSELEWIGHRPLDVFGKLVGTLGI